MNIAVGNDHRGYAHKSRLLQALAAAGHTRGRLRL